MLFFVPIRLVLFVLVFGLGWLCVTDLLRLWRWGGVRWANNVQNALGISNTLLMLRCHATVSWNFQHSWAMPSTFSWNFQHALDATPSTFMAPRYRFKPDMQYWVHNPWAKKMRRFGRDSGMIRSLHLESLFAQYFQDRFWVWRCLKMVMMDLTGRTCDWCHDIRRWFEFQAPFTSFDIVQRRRTSGPVRIYTYIFFIYVFIYLHAHIDTFYILYNIYIDR
jgi:hypothetical protein